MKTQYNLRKGRLPRALFSAVVMTITTSLLYSGQVYADDVDQAKTLFNAGAQAFNVGKFSAAIQAFEAAYKLAPRPGILFSLAQAQKRQYFVDSNPQMLRLAIENYKKYLTVADAKGRKSDAAQALAELEPIAEKVLKSGAAVPVPTVTAAAPQVMITSSTPGAMVSMDGGSPSEQPFVGELKPGKHNVVVSAPGHYEEKRDIVAPESGAFALDIVLREQPAVLSIAAPSSAQILIDGRPSAIAPISKPIEVPAGRHLVTIVKNGYVGYSEEIEVQRGEQRSIVVRLSQSTQRYASIGLLSVGGLALVGGTLFALGASSKEKEAQQILDERKSQNITTSQLDKYEKAVQDRDNLRTGAGVALGAGLAIGTVGFLFYMFDTPNSTSIPVLIRPREGGPAPPPPPPRKLEPTEVSAAPIFGPGFMGGAVTGRF